MCYLTKFANVKKTETRAFSRRVTRILLQAKQTPFESHKMSNAAAGIAHLRVDTFGG